jgi:hypothetical protein
MLLALLLVPFLLGNESDCDLLITTEPEEIEEDDDDLIDDVEEEFDEIF